MGLHIPDPIRVAAAGMLAPFGVDLNQLLLAGTEKQVGAKFIPLKEVEKTYGLGRWSIGRLIKAGKISAAKMSPARAGKVLIDAESLENFLASTKISKEGGKNDR